MRHFYRLSFILVIMESCTAWAIYNDVDPKQKVYPSGIPAQVCSIVQVPKGGSFTLAAKNPNLQAFVLTEGDQGLNDELCSASVVGNNQILIAAHCFYNEHIHPDQDLELVCPGGVSSILDLSTLKIYPTYKNPEDWNRVDLALIKTKSNLGIPPLMIEKDPRVLLTLTESPNNCMSVGYGTNESTRLAGRCAQERSDRGDSLLNRLL